MDSIRDILSDKLQFERENEEMQKVLNATGANDEEHKVKQHEAEQEQLKLKENRLKFLIESRDNLMKHLADEEGKARNQLDDKIKITQELAKDDEQLKKLKELYEQNKEEIVRAKNTKVD